MTGTLSLDYEQKRDRKIVYGMKRNGTPLGKTAGKYSPSPVTVRFLLDDYTNLLLPALTTLGLGSYGDASFPMMLTYEEPLNPLSTVNIAWAGCTIDGEKDAIAEGTDEAAVDVTIGPLAMTRNGQLLWSVTRSVSL